MPFNTFTCQLGIPLPCLVIKLGGDKFGVAPDIQLHGMNIIFKPSSHHVFGQKFWPNIWKWDVGQMIDGSLVVQHQRLISFAPVVSDPGVALNHQTVDVQLSQPGGYGQTSLSRTNDQYRGLPILIAGFFFTLFQPVGTQKAAPKTIAQFGFALEAFFMACNFNQCGHQSPGFGCTRLGRLRQSDHTFTWPDLGLKIKKDFNGVNIGSLDPLRRHALLIHLEIMRTMVSRGMDQRLWHG